LKTGGRTVGFYAIIPYPNLFHVIKQGCVCSCWAVYKRYDRVRTQQRVRDLRRSLFTTADEALPRTVNK